MAALIASSALAFDALRYVGAAYLVYLGIKAWRSARRAGRASASLTARTYRQAIVVQLLNPKVALFFLAFLPQFVDPERGPVATAGARVRRDPRRARPGDGLPVRDRSARGRRAKRFSGLNKVSGAVYVALGAAAALTGGRR